MNGDEVPLSFASGYGWTFITPRNLRQTLFDSATATTNSAAVVLSGCDFDPVSGLPTITPGSIDVRLVIPATIAESGNYAVTLTNVTTTYG
jgi:hypothetical protein